MLRRITKLLQKCSASSLNFLSTCLLLIIYNSSFGEDDNFIRKREDGLRLLFIDSSLSLSLQKQALSTARQRGDWKQTSISFARMYTSLIILQHSYGECLSYADSALYFARKSRDGTALGWAFKAKASYYSHVGKKDQALYHFLQSAHYFRSVGNFALLAETLSDIGTIYAYSDRQRGIHILDSAVRIAERSKDPHAIITTKGNYGFVRFLLDEKKDVELANEGVRYLKATADQADANAEYISGKSLLALAHFNLAVFCSQQLPADDTALFLSELHKTEELCRQYNIGILYPNVLGIKANHYKAQGNFTEARKLLLQGIEVMQRNQHPSNHYIALNYENLKEIAIKEKNLNEYAYFDSLYEAFVKKQSQEEIAKSIEEVNTRFETKQKNQRIQQLTHEAAITRDLIFLSSCVVGLLITGVLFLLRNNLLKRKLYQEQMALFHEREKSLQLELELKRKESIEALSEQLNAEHRMLRAQLNPHFLFNAMANLQSFLIQEKSDEALTYLDSLALLTRKILEGSRTDWISLKEEIEILKTYVSVQKPRLSGRLHFNISCHGNFPDLAQVSIPPMLLQPILENAIQHGLMPLKNREPILQIDFYFDNKDFITCKVLDNGIGIEASERRKRRNSHNSMAMTIIRDRLDRLLIAQPNAFIIENIEEASEGFTGTRIILLIPVKLNI